MSINFAFATLLLGDFILNAPPPLKNVEVWKLYSVLQTLTVVSI